MSTRSCVFAVCCLLLATALPSLAQTRPVLPDTEEPITVPNTPAQSPTAGPPPKSTWLTAAEEETNAYLGPENAALCKKSDISCVQPIIVSVMCDASQFLSCRTIARAIRFSEKLYLLYPFRTSKEEQAMIADLMIVYTYEPEYGSHTINIIPQKNNGRFFATEKSRTVPKLHHGNISVELISDPLLLPQDLSKTIEHKIRSMENPTP